MDRRRFLQGAGGAAGIAGLSALSAGKALALGSAPAAVGSRAQPTLPEAFFAPDLIYPANSTSPQRLADTDQRRILVIGGGLGGLSAALELAERGYRVTLKDGAERFGGRLHTRQESLRTGRFAVEHGLHMWFHQYYNTLDVLERLGSLQRYFMPFEEVFYKFRDYQPETIRSVGPYPLNLVGILNSSPNLNLLDGAGTLGAIPDIIFYDQASNWQRFDHLTYEQWRDQTNVNRKFWDIILEPAASVTLNDVSKISAAEMLLYMHYFFIGNPQAFHRQIPTVDHETAVIGPWVERLRRLGVDLQLNAPVKGLRLAGGRAIGEVGGSDDYDGVVLATDVPGTRRIIAGSQAADDPSQSSLEQLSGRLGRLETAPPYSVLRVWFDKAPRPRPFNQCVIETPQHRPINLIAEYSQFEQQSIDWAKRSGGSVIEFHLYNTPQLAGLGADEVWRRIRTTAGEVLPELNGMQPLDYSLGCYENFTSFASGQGLNRPTTRFARDCGLRNMGLAGDWVATAYPTALMERAVSTGRECANAILRDDQIREVPIKAAKSRGPGVIPQV